MDSHFTSSFQAMRLSRKRRMRGFYAAVIFSVVLHAAGVGGAVYASRKPDIPKLDSAIPVQLVKLGKKRDPKLLPRKVDEPPPPPPEEAVKLDSGEKPKPEVKKEEK